MRRLVVIGLLCGILVVLIGCFFPPIVPHTVPTPNRPTIDEPTTSTTWPSGRLMFFKTNLLNCSQGHSVQYKWRWGDGTYSDSEDGREWIYIESWYHTYETPGTYQVDVMARCTSDPSVTSGWSEVLEVTIVEPEPPAPGEWLNVATWEGTGSRTTETFYVNASEWRIKWSLRATEPDWDYEPWLLISVRDNGGNYVATIMSSDSWGTGYVHSGPGNFFLELDGIFTEWDVAVQVRHGG